MNLRDAIPIPELRRARKVLAIFPHPDDAELAAGGTVALLTSEGVQVTYALATDGEMGAFDPSLTPQDVSKTRRAEQEEAARLLGVSQVMWLGFRDGFLPDIEILRKSMVGVIRQTRPDFVMTLDPWLPYEAHPDHRTASLAAVEACTFASMPLYYAEDLRDGLLPWGVTGIAMAFSAKPNTYINVDHVWEKKIDACLCHRSQFPKPQWEGMFYPLIQSKAMEWGQQAGSTYAEAFKVLSPFHLHIMVDAWRM